ncbi:MAG: LysR substrate-binding domain-containing protein, partial [Rhizobiaceae bacterium]
MLVAYTENGLGISILPQYVAQKALRRGQLVQVLIDYILPEQELHAVF